MYYDSFFKHSNWFDYHDISQMVFDKEITQIEAVYKILKKAGRKGVNSFDFYKLYIPRVADVVFKFNNRGGFNGKKFKVESIKNKDQSCTYIMKSL